MTAERVGRFVGICCVGSTATAVCGKAGVWLATGLGVGLTNGANMFWRSAGLMEPLTDGLELPRRSLRIWVTDLVIGLVMLARIGSSGSALI